jgi:LemA protein
MEDAKQLLSRDKFNDKEVEEILKRAAQLQQEVETAEKEVNRSDLEAGAKEVGISQEFIERAIQELKAEQQRQAVRKKKLTLIIGIPAVIFAIIVILSAFNSHRVLNAQLSVVESKQAQLDNVLQRRHNLIPNLIAIAKASATHEKDLVASISTLIQEIKQTKQFADKQPLENRLDAKVQQLMLEMRSDPETSSTAVFIRLSDEMAGTENRISVERKRYNEAVSAYNSKARSFPSVLLNPILGLPKNIPYFQVSEEAKKAPKF